MPEKKNMFFQDECEEKVQQINAIAEEMNSLKIHFAEEKNAKVHQAS